MRPHHAAAALALLALTACSSPPEDPQAAATERACDRFADSANSDFPRKQLLVDTMRPNVQAGNPRLTPSFEALERTVNASDTAWALAADMMARTCLDLGWKH